MPSTRIGVDVGGTFTDLAVFDTDAGELRFAKTPSTPENPALGVSNGLQQLLKDTGQRPSDIVYFIHGTTVALNTVLERSGSRTALVTTAGFRDVLQIGRQNRPHLYDWSVRRPDPLVPRRLRFEVPERVLHTGEVLETLPERAIHSLIDKLQQAELDAVAVCLLHSYANPIHEKALGDAIREALPDLRLSLSCDVLPEFKEYDRMSTTAINAYVSGRTGTYLAGLQQTLQSVGVTSGVHVMQSNGGVVSANAAAERPVHTLLSGPAAGVIGGTAIASMAGEPNSITIDMGGTSFDVALCYRGEVARSREGEVGGLPVKSPAIDLHTLGAGGGSIAWIDAGGALRVGPQSAGANPGPACYGSGGVAATVTDANLVLGRVGPGSLLGGGMRLDTERARFAIKREIADPLRLTVEQAASGIIRVVNSSMIKGIRVVSVAKGLDPREFVLAAFGGAGPLHATELAAELHVPRVLLPIAPGVTSALGLLMADMRRDYIRTVLHRADEDAAELLELRFADMERQAMEDMANEHINWDDVFVLRAVEARYQGQGFELDVIAPSGPVGTVQIDEIVNRFHVAHKERYGYASLENSVEIVNIHLSATASLPMPSLEIGKDAKTSSDVQHSHSRPVYFEETFLETPVIDRRNLDVATQLTGPAVVEQLDSTSLLWPGQRATVDMYGNLRVEVDPS